MTRCDARIRREESRSVGARSHLLRTLSPSLYMTWNLQLRVYRLFVRNGQPRQASHRFERSSLVAGRPKPKCHILWHRKSSICKQMQPSFWIYKLPRHLCYDQATFHEIAYSFFFPTLTASQGGENESPNVELKETPSAGSDCEASATVMSSSFGILAL